MSGKFKTYRRDMIVYKRLSGNKIATLLIPAGTKCFMGRKKCRAECAIVLQIEGVKTIAYGRYLLNTRYERTGKHYEIGTSLWPANARQKRKAPRKTYFVGQEVRPLFPFSLVKNECESGIHFFRYFESALEFQL